MIVTKIDRKTDWDDKRYLVKLHADNPLYPILIQFADSQDRCDASRWLSRSELADIRNVINEALRLDDEDTLSEKVKVIIDVSSS